MIFLISSIDDELNKNDYKMKDWKIIRGNTLYPEIQIHVMTDRLKLRRIRIADTTDYNVQAEHVTNTIKANNEIIPGLLLPKTHALHSFIGTVNYVATNSEIATTTSITLFLRRRNTIIYCSR